MKTVNNRENLNTEGKHTGNSIKHETGRDITDILERNKICEKLY